MMWFSLMAQEWPAFVMIPRSPGKIIQHCSIAGFKGIVPTPASTLLGLSTQFKAAAINLTRALAGEWGPYNINVNLPSARYFRPKWPKDLEKVTSLIKRHTLGRIGGEEDIKGCVFWRLKHHVT